MEDPWNFQKKLLMSSWRMFQCRLDSQSFEPNPQKEVRYRDWEGVVVRNPDSKYVTKRDPNSLKVKNFQDAECEVIEHHKGEGKYKNSFGSLTCRTSEGIAFDIGAGFTENERKNPPHIGAMITYKYQEITKGGKPRFPVYLRTKEEI